MKIIKSTINNIVIRMVKMCERVSSLFARHTYIYRERESELQRGITAIVVDVDDGDDDGIIRPG